MGVTSKIHPFCRPLHTNVLPLGSRSALDSPDEKKLEKLRRGIYLEDGPTKPAAVEITKRTKANTWCEITVTEGRNRLVKRMFWRIKHPVMRLIRSEFAGVSVEGVPPGQYRLLTKGELNKLKSWLR